NASLFLGAAIAISSSTVLSKVLGERGALGSVHGRISLGWAAVQDLSLIVIVVILSSLASGGTNLFHDVIVGGGKALLFLIVLVPVGSRLLPFVLLRISALRSREIFILAVAGIALGTAYLASLFGLSTALGAFVAGIVVSESDLSHQILGVIMPLRDIFAGLFFVSIGMLVDPSYVLHHMPLILLAVLLIIVVKGVVSTGLVASLGGSLGVAVLTGVALAQAGEFSFLLGRLGVDLNALNDGEFSLILAATATTIILAPAAYQLAIPAVARYERGRPKEIVDDQLANPAHPPLHGHAVICGYGRVGRLIGGALRRRGLPFVVVEQDVEIAHRLRQDGIRVIVGHSDNFTTLQHVGIGQARLLVVAIPGALETRQTVGNARLLNPALQVIARVQSESERDYMQRQDVIAIIGERELGLEITRLTLRRFGVSAMEALAVVQRLRD
ncbi:MAG TPA: cation:proton antiporter, partial [Thermomicrobiaceae bacterium]|nr:cation:proton antiporter [Thermomicrobiaceae bacterium]